MNFTDPAHHSTDTIIMFKRLENSKIFTLQNANTAGKTQNIASVYYFVEISLRPDVFFSVYSNTQY